MENLLALAISPLTYFRGVDGKHEGEEDEEHDVAMGSEKFLEVEVANGGGGRGGRGHPTPRMTARRRILRKRRKIE